MSQPLHKLHLTVRNSLSEIGRIAAVIEEFCAEHSLGETTANAINLALDELLTNTISYGYDDKGAHAIDVTLVHDRDRVTLTLRDDARAFDPTTAAEPDIEADIDERPVGGLGIHLVRAMMDKVEYQRVDGYNQLTLTKMIKA